jgi:D-alanyl-lipoteichoic acid acyltransferase DltB (MBOAT superfamily)
MLFTSINFILFFITYIFFVTIFKKNWKLVTIFFSIFFYSYWSIYFSLLLVFTAYQTWFFASIIQKSKNYRKIYLIISLIISLSILFIFKYFNFFINEIFGIDLKNSIFLKIILPIGISFYTFQCISYIVDIYKNKISCATLVNFLVFILFFPHLIAGPLVRASSFIPQVEKGIYFNWGNIRIGTLYIFWGYFLKLCISNNLGIYVNTVFSHLNESNTPTLIVASIFNSFLIYSDFSGYSLIAIGISRLIGLKIPANFVTPFFSINLTDFWRRWHISLSKFLKDYLYIPLGGNKNGLLNTIRNILIVMFIGGLWHGASINFIIWGILHAIFLIIEKINKDFLRIDIKIIFLKKLYVFLLITIFFIPFSVLSFKDFLIYIDIFAFKEFFNYSQVIEKFYVIRNFLFIFILLLVETFIDKRNFIKLKNNSLLYGLLLTMLIAVIFSIGNFDEKSFIYFQF